MPVMSRHMVDHLADIKGLCEARAARSRVFGRRWGVGMGAGELGWVGLRDGWDAR